jgi:uncharacterized protein YdeI (YjbR/CyaY-like superfamily)
MNQLRVNSIEEWREWLAMNYDRETEVWLIFRKKEAGEVPFDYPEALDEALVHGWVDSLIRGIDEKEYMRKFTPRQPMSNWSEVNKKKVERLIGEGRMKPAGMKAVEIAKKNGQWDKGGSPPDIDNSLPGALLQALEKNSQAKENYFGMKRSHQKQYNIWINSAKMAETIQRRVEESVRLLEKGEQLGLK